MAVKRKLLLVVLLAALLAAFAAPVFAVNLTITGTNLVGAAVNTRQSVDVLNLSFNVTNVGDGLNHVNITHINFTIVNGTAGNETVLNISAVQIKNSTGSVIASNTSNSSVNSYIVYIPNGLVVNGTTNGSVVINLNMSRAATRTAQIAVNISNYTLGITSGIAVVNTTNITFFGGANSNQSRFTSIKDVHANATISPRIVDTGVENQTFSYLFNITGGDNIANFTIDLPAGYTLANITVVEKGGSNLTTEYRNNTPTNKINISLDTPTTQYVKVYFRVNTSASPVVSSGFASTIHDSELGNVTTDVSGNLTNVTTMNIINATTVSIRKGVAIINGTSAGVGSDYWEFDLAFNFNESVSGWLQFRMSNWTDRINQTISFSSCSPSCGSLRQDINASLNSSKINITNTYDPTYGITMSPAKGNVTTLFLRMLIPAGTPISQTWSATYFALFRAMP